MTDQKRRSELEVWTALLSGQATDQEQVTLTETVDSDSQLADELRADARIHQLFRALNHVPREDEAFVAAVLGQCETAAANASSSEDESEIWFAEASPFDIVTDDVTEPFNCVELADDEASDCRLQVLKQVQPLKAVRPRAVRKPVWSTVVVLVVFIAGVLTGVFWRRDQQHPAVDGRVAGGSVRDDVSLPEDRAGSNDSRLVPQPKTGLASLRNVGSGEWSTPRTENERLLAGPLRLLRGRGEGPSEVRLLADRQVALDRGQLLSLRPTGARPVEIATPVSRVTEGGGLDQNGRYVVAVDDSGSAELEVFEGVIDVEPLGTGAAQPEHFTLSRERLNRASFVRSNPDAGRRSVLAAARSTEGDFKGVVSLDGESLTFDSEPAFNSLLNGVVAKFHRQPDSVVRDWPLVKQTMTGVLQRGGSIDLNGKPAGIQDILNLIQQQIDGNNAQQPTSSFQGTINVNGDTRTFSTRKEFDAAVKNLFPQDTLPPLTTPNPSAPNGTSQPDQSEPKPTDKPDGPVNPFLPDTNDA